MEHDAFDTSHQYQHARSIHVFVADITYAICLGHALLEIRQLSDNGQIRATGHRVQDLKAVQSEPSSEQENCCGT